MNGIQRIQACFLQQKAHIAYLTAGDGGIQKTLPAALALIAGGVNILEIGVPHSDPVGDGPVIQRAAQRALQQGTTLKDILFLTTEIRKVSDIPLILFSYFNPILSVLSSSFLADAAQAGIDGALIVDCPLEESAELRAACLQQNIAPINLIAPSTSLERSKKLDHYGRGFLYYACQKGTTGVRNELPDDFITKIQAIKEHVHLPVVVGFGIGERKIVEEVLKYADGVVVGSLFVKALEDGMLPQQLTEMAKELFLP